MKATVIVYVILGTLPFLTLATPLLPSQVTHATTLVTPALASTTTVTTNTVITRIIIPKLNTDLVVKPAAVEGDTWQTFEDAAGLATGTPQNNLVVFAHAKPQMFRALGSLEVNDPVYLLRDNTYQEYQVVGKHWVTPNDLNSVVISNSDQATLTLFTCDGYNDESRVVVKAILKGGEI